MGNAALPPATGIARCAPKRRRCSFPVPMLFLPLLALPPLPARLDEPSAVLTGHVRISYVNHSPDSLSDFFVHQYLNAFRPGSRWALADSAEGRDRFQHLGDPDYAFERITSARLMGVEGAPDYPYAPDSTIAHWRLPRPLPPGDSLQAELDWRA